MWRHGRRWAIARTLVQAGAPASDTGVRYAHPTADQARLGVIFPGQGSQYVGMGRTAALRHPALRQTLDRAEQALRDAGRGSLFQRMSPNEENEVILSELKEFRLSNNERTRNQYHD